MLGGPRLASLDASRCPIPRGGRSSPTVKRSRLAGWAGYGYCASREFSCQWIVRAHRHRQAYGPGRTLRKAILIAQHIKGPVDKPLRLRDAVKVWDHKEVRGRHRAVRGGGAGPFGGSAVR
jgi:hypothetical protein